MTEEDLKNIQKKIGYNFKNICLLQQAFIRESYIEEDKEHCSNESLKWVGEKVLGFILDQKLIANYMQINELQELASKATSENEIVELEESFFSESFIAKQIESFGLNQYFVMGERDIKRKANNMYSVKSELLKSLIGAVAIDSNYNMFSIRSVIDLILDVDYYLEHGFAAVNYLFLLHKWAQMGDYPAPRYEFNANSFSYGTNFFQCTCVIDKINRTFSAKGKNKSEARMNSAKLAYEYLQEKGLLFTIKDEVKVPMMENAINQLQELSLKGYFSMPEYDAIEEKDLEHDQIWHCTCHINEIDKTFTATALTKKDAKKSCAYQMLLYVLN